MTSLLAVRPRARRALGAVSAIAVAAASVVLGVPAAAATPAAAAPAAAAPAAAIPAVAPVATAAAAPAVVQCYGDSMLDALCRPAPQAFGVTMPGVEARNFAIGGMTSTSIATAAGLHQLSLSRDVTIPASGAVRLAEPTGLVEAAQLAGRLVMRASIGGVPGLLNHRPDLSPAVPWEFVRDSDAAGAATPVPAGTPIESLQKAQPGAASLIWAGTNNLERPDRVLQDVAAMVEAHRAVSDAPYWIVSVTPAWSDRWSTVGRNRVEINEQLERWYGQRYIPLDEYLANGALYDAGIVPTQADRDAIDRGFNPRSFWRTESDLTHLNFHGQMIAARLITRFITEGATLDEIRGRFDARSTMDVSVSGSSATVSGWAIDHSDLFRSIQVGVTIDGVWRGATLANLPSNHLFAFGIPGKHGYSWRFDGLSPGEHTICSVAVGFGAGDHFYPPCRTVTIAGAAAAPIGQVTTAEIGGRTTAIYGWTFPPDSPARSLPVAILVDGRWHTAVRADMPTPYLSGVPGDHAFWTAIRLRPGHHAACAVAIESASSMTNLGCHGFTVD